MTATTSTECVRADCYAAELIWPQQQADDFRRMMIDAVGRDCVCEPGGHCPLLEGALTVLETVFPVRPVEPENVDEGPAVRPRGAPGGRGSPGGDPMSVA